MMFMALCLHGDMCAEKWGLGDGARRGRSEIESIESKYCCVALVSAVLRREPGSLLKKEIKDEA